MRHTARTGVDTGQTLATYAASIGDRWSRGIDTTSTYDPVFGRTAPARAADARSSAGRHADRRIWSTGRSTSGKANSADRPSRTPWPCSSWSSMRQCATASSRAIRPRTGPGGAPSAVHPPRWMPAARATSPCPMWRRWSFSSTRVVEAGEHQSWGDVVTILATTALRISEVAGLLVGDVDLGPRACCSWLARPTPAEADWSRSRPKDAASAQCRSSSLYVRR